MGVWTEFSEFSEKKFLFFSEYWPWLGDEAMTFSCVMAGSVSRVSLYQSQNGSLSPDYIDKEHIPGITPDQNTFIKGPAPSERLVRNAQEMFWHWHVTCVWTLWPGEGPGLWGQAGDDCDEWASSGWRSDAASPGMGSIRICMDQSELESSSRNDLWV